MTLPTEFELMPLREKALGGGLEGAQRNTRELATWNPPMGPADTIISPVKDVADARSRDVVMNDGYMLGAINAHRDSIVGNQYRLNSNPNYRVLGADEAWAEEFQQEVEARFNLISDSNECWLHAGGRLTLTGIVRMSIAQFMVTGEVLGTGEYKRSSTRPCATAFQFVSPDRLCNPDMRMDDKYLRRGIKLDDWGAPVSAFIRTNSPYDYLGLNTLTHMFNWKEIPFRLPWGRMQVLHIQDALDPEQTRGISDMVSVLKQIKMTKNFQDVTLQNAVVNASYAAALESELPADMVAAAMGQGQTTFGAVAYDYMSMLAQYMGAAGAIQIDGAKIPQLFPNTKLRMQPMGTPGGVGTPFEESLLRYIAAGLGLSYEQFSKDYSKVNYSSARAGQNEAFKMTQSRKKLIADRVATEIYTLWLEEDIMAGNLPMYPGFSKDKFYRDPLVKAALAQCGWIGAGRGQIDELKETQSAMMRIKSGLSTFEKECARLGEDFREIFKQRQREDRMIQEMGLTFTMDASKPGSNEVQKTVRGEGNDDSVQSDYED